MSSEKISTTEDTGDTEARSRTGNFLRVLGVLRGGVFLLASLLIFAMLLGSGCGYTLAGRGSFLPAYIKTIGIPTFTNRTSVFNIETQITQKVRSEFIGRGKYTVLPDATGVDALLTGEISSISIQPSAFTANQLASRYAITMSARIELRDMKTNTVLWENPGLSFRQEYDASSTNVVDVNAFFGQDANALDRLTSEFARTIVSAILEAF